MEKVDRLLEKLEKEIFERVNTIVEERDEFIKQDAQKAYDAEVQKRIADIKVKVQKEYAVAKAYLTELKTETIVETPEEAVPEVVEEPAVEEGRTAPQKGLTMAITPTGSAKVL